MEDLCRPIWNENGEMEGYECGLCRLERDKQTRARKTQYQLRQKKSGREVWVSVCEEHFGIVESPNSPYEIIQRF
jgi:hypothetical protein